MGIDPQSRDRIYTMLESLLDRGTAILLTTHQLDEAQSRCDRIAIIDGGRIIESGSFQELLDRTIGTTQQLSLRFNQRLSEAPAPLILHESGLEATAMLTGGNYELPRLLSQLIAANVGIEHMLLREPSLEQLFLHLTGKELRE